MKLSLIDTSLLGGTLSFSTMNNLGGGCLVEVKHLSSFTFNRPCLVASKLIFLAESSFFVSITGGAK